LLDLGRFFSFLILYTIGRTPWAEDQPVARPQPTHRITQTQNKRTKTSITPSAIRTHDPSVRANEDSSYLRPRGHCDRPLNSSADIINGTKSKRMRRTGHLVRDEKLIQNFNRKTWRGDYLKDLSVDGKIILE
jgi:hypothetical protein